MDLLFFRVSILSGSATLLASGMNFAEYWSNPRNDLTSEAFFGFSAFSWGTRNSHFCLFKVNPFSLSTLRILIKFSSCTF